MPTLPQPKKDYLRVDEVAEITRRTSRTVYRWIQNDKLTCVKVLNRGLLVPSSALGQVIRLNPSCYEESS